MIEALPNAMFRVKLDNDHVVLGHVAGKMRRFRIRILPGDRVRCELLPLRSRPRANRLPASLRRVRERAARACRSSPSTRRGLDDRVGRGSELALIQAIAAELNQGGGTGRAGVGCYADRRRRRRGARPGGVRDLGGRDDRGGALPAGGRLDDALTGWPAGARRGAVGPCGNGCRGGRGLPRAGTAAGVDEEQALELVRGAHALARATGVAIARWGRGCGTRAHGVDHGRRLGRFRG